MRRVLPLLLIGPATALVALLAAVAVPTPSRHTRPRSGADTRLAGFVARVDVLGAALERISSLEHRLDRLEAGLDSLNEGRVATASASHGPERARLLDELEHHAQDLAGDWRQRASAIEAWATVAEHAGEPERKAKAWFEQAKLSDHARAADLLRNVIETVGLEHELGQEAARLLGHCESALGNMDRALRIWRALADTPGLPIELEVRTRKMIADRCVTLRDPETALAEYERLAADFRNHPYPKFRSLAESAARSAEHLRKRLGD